MHEVRKWQILLKKSLFPASRIPSRGFPASNKTRGCKRAG